MALRRLVGPVFLAALLIVLAFGFATYLIARQQDAISLEIQRNTLSEKLAKRHEEAAILAEDNAWWDQAVENTIFTENLNWIEVNLGQSVVGISRLSAAIMLRHDNSLLYEKVRDAVPSANLLLAHSQFQNILATIPPPANLQPSSASGFFTFNNNLYAYGISIITAAGDELLSQEFDPTQATKLIFLVKMNAARIAEDAKEISAQKVRFMVSDTAIPDHKATLALYDHTGNPAGFICWEPFTPGMGALKALVVPAAFTLMALAVLMVLFYRQAANLVSKLEAGDKAKSQFLASMSHEIRTPLNAVLGFSELLASEKFGKVEGKKNKEYLSIINKSGQHLLDIINDILDISKLDGDKYGVDPSKINMAEAAKQAVAMVRGVANERDITVKQHIDPAYVYTDPRLVRQILLNILANAVKFEPDGGKVLIEGKCDMDGYVIIVSDHGPGMTPAQIKTALSLFGQVGSPYISRRSHGTGLGLPLVQRFLKLIGGSIDITSTPGAGTRVYLHFASCDGSEVTAVADIADTEPALEIH